MGAVRADPPRRLEARPPSRSGLDVPSLEHDGSGPGFYAALIVVPSKDIVVALAANGGNETKEEGTAFTEAVRAAVTAVPEP
jgi:hypothetical protein